MIALTLNILRYWLASKYCIHHTHIRYLVPSKVASNSFEVLTIQNYNQTFWVAKDQ